MIKNFNQAHISFLQFLLWWSIARKCLRRSSFQEKVFWFSIKWLVGSKDKCISCHRLLVKCIWPVKRSIWKFDLEKTIVVEFFVLLLQRDSFFIWRNSYAIFNFGSFLVGFWLDKFPRALTIKIFKKYWDFLNHHLIIKEKNSFE